MSRFLYLVVFLALVTCNVQCIMFDLEAKGMKCIRDVTGHNVLVSGSYEVSPGALQDPTQKVDYTIKSPEGGILHTKENLESGKFSFVADGGYEICFISKAPNRNGVIQVIKLEVKQGVEAKSYDSISEVSHLKPMERDLKKLEDLSDAIVQDFLEMKLNEEDMRNTNESTNSRVLFFSIFSMCCLLGLATWQTLYLRRFFKAKKLIE